MQPLIDFDSFILKMEEDGESSSMDASFSTLDSIPGMGEPILAARGIIGSGDVATPSKKKRVKKFKDFLTKNK